MQARLKVLHDKANVKQVKLLPVTLIGRSTECNLKIASSQVSRNHCRITLGEDAVYVEDLGSANGTLVDGQLITPHQPTAIAPGARLVVGPAEFVIDYVATTSATIVLPRSGVPRAPEMPSTEMIFPVASAPAIETVAQAPISPSVPEIAPQQVAVVNEIAVPPEPIPAVPEQIAAVQPPVETIPATSTPHADTELLDPAFNFGFADTAPADPEIDQPTEFMFGVATPEFTSSAAATPPPAEPPKKGLKSLFSMFGRKEKGATAKHEATVPDAAPVAPSVFLPTMDANSTPDAAPEDLAFAPPAEANVPTVQEPAQPAAEPTDEDNGFSQFLSNL
ncbi:MAG: FHA domain-containing protein [Planctomycetota bacterium]